MIKNPTAKATSIPTNNCGADTAALSCGVAGSTFGNMLVTPSVSCVAPGAVDVSVRLASSLRAASATSSTVLPGFG